MLVLSRREGEFLVIDTPCGRILVTVASIRGQQVRIGIQAPADFAVARLEVMSETDQKSVRASAS